MNTTAPAPTAADIKALAVEVQDLHAKYTAVLSRVEGLANGLQCLIESLRSDMEIRAAERAEDDAAVVIAALERRRNVDRVVVVDDGTMYAPARRVCGIMFDAGGYSLGCTLAEGHEHPEKHDATPGPCAKVSGTVTIVDASGAAIGTTCADCKATRDEIHGALCSVRSGATPGYAEGAIHAGPDGLKVSA